MLIRLAPGWHRNTMGMALGDQARNCQVNGEWAKAKRGDQSSPISVPVSTLLGTAGLSGQDTLHHVISGWTDKGSHHGTAKQMLATA